MIRFSEGDSISIESTYLPIYLDRMEHSLLPLATSRTSLVCLEVGSNGKLLTHAAQKIHRLHFNLMVDQPILLGHINCLMRKYACISF